MTVTKILSDLAETKKSCRTKKTVFFGIKMLANDRMKD